MDFFGLFTRPLKQAQVPTSIELINDAGTLARGNVIFLHGLDGDPIASWEFGADRENWGTWLLATVPDINIYSVGYRVRATKLVGGAMPMTQRSVNVLALLQGRLKTDIPTVFICHSYGGLLAKQMLRSAIDVSTEYKDLANSVRGIVFFGTPHSGASLADYLDALRVISRPSTAIEELKQSGANLLELNQWFRNRFKDLNTQVLVFFETMATFKVSVVNAASADPGINGVTPIAIDSDHIDLPKPSTAGDVRVSQTVAFVSKIIQASPPKLIGQLTPMQRVIAAPNNQLRRVIEELEDETRRWPEDTDRRKALSRAKEQYERITTTAEYTRLEHTKLQLPDTYNAPQSTRPSLATGVLIVLISVLTYAYFEGWLDPITRFFSSLF